MFNIMALPQVLQVPVIAYWTNTMFYLLMVVHDYSDSRGRPEWQSIIQMLRHFTEEVNRVDSI